MTNNMPAQHVPQNPAVTSEAPSGKLLAEDRRKSDRVNVNRGPQTYADADPGMTAAGDGNGHDIDFFTEGASGSSPGPTPDKHASINVVTGG